MQCNSKQQKLFIKMKLSSYFSKCGIIFLSIIISLTSCKKKNLSDVDSEKKELETSGQNQKNPDGAKNLDVTQLQSHSVNSVVKSPSESALQTSSLMPQDTAVARLLRAYEQSNAATKNDIIDQLITTNSEESLRGLFYLSKGIPPGELKVSICQKILELNMSGKQDFLIGALPTLDPDIARSVCRTLGLYADDIVIEKIVAAYDQGTDINAKKNYLNVLQNATVPTAVPSLTRILSDPESSIDDEVVYSVAVGLSKNGSPPSVSALLSKLNATKSEHEIDHLNEIISSIEQPESEQALIYGALGNKDTSSLQSRIAAIHALANYSSQESLNAIRSLLKDANEEVRQTAQSSLDKLGSK